MVYLTAVEARALAAALISAADTLDGSTQGRCSDDHNQLPAGGKQEYLGDQYDRLRNGCEILAADPGMIETDPIYGADGLRAFTQSLIDARMLEGLSEHDADTPMMLFTPDFTRGPERMGVSRTG